MSPVCRQTIPIGPGEARFANIPRREQGFSFMAYRNWPRKDGNVLAEKRGPLRTHREPAFPLGRKIKTGMRIGRQFTRRGLNDAEPPTRRSAAILPGKAEQAIALRRPGERVCGEVHALCELFLRAGFQIEVNEPALARNRRLQPVRIKREWSGNGKRGEPVPTR